MLKLDAIVFVTETSAFANIFSPNCFDVWKMDYISKQFFLALR